MRFKGLDLNLLVVLDALIAERNVTRAAERLNLSQSATSSALGRLREFFKDELLVQSGRHFKLSPRAEELLPILKGVLSDVERKIITGLEFDPRTAQRRIRIMTSDYVTIAALTRGLESIGRIAPQLSFQIFPVVSDPNYAIERYDVDLLIAPDSYASEIHPYVPYFEDNYVCLVDRENPITQDALTLERYLDMPHVVVRFAGTGAKAYDDRHIEQLGYKKNVVIIAPSHATLAYYVPNSNRIVTIQRKLAELIAPSLKLKILLPPIEIPNLKEILQWHSLNDGEPVLKWVGVSLCEIQSGTFREADWM